MNNVAKSVGIMKNVNLNLKPVRATKLPLKVKTTINYGDFTKRAIEKHSHHDQFFCGLEEYVLPYPDGKETLFLPGIASTRFLTPPRVDNLTPTRKSWENRISR